MKISKRSGITTVLLGSLLAACGSDSSDTPVFNDETGTLKGIFVDSPVSGLEYMTSSGLTGRTNSAGEFNYLEGDTVSFSLGPLLLGAATALPSITPFDLVGFELPSASFNFGDSDNFLTIESDGSSAFVAGVNMLIFLQSLDNNDNPDDGIEILSAIASFFLQTGAALQFDQDTEDFVAAFFILFAQLVANDILDRDADETPVDRDDALSHFITSNAL